MVSSSSFAGSVRMGGRTDSRIGRIGYRRQQRQRRSSDNNQQQHHLRHTEWRCRRRQRDHHSVNQHHADRCECDFAGSDDDRHRRHHWHDDDPEYHDDSQHHHWIDDFDHRLD